MKNKFLSLFTLLLAVSGIFTANAQNIGTWKKRINIPDTYVGGGIATSGDSIIYIFGVGHGLTNQGTYSYNINTNTWKQKANMSYPEYLAPAMYFDGKFYVIGGIGVTSGGYTSTSNTVQIYDPTTDTWTTGANMPTARGEESLAIMDNEIYAIGGWPYSITTVEIYNPKTNTWRSGVNLPTQKGMYGGIQGQYNAQTANDSIYVIGGQLTLGPSDGISTASNFVFDKSKQEWISRKSLPSPNAFNSSATVNNKIHILGGTPKGTTSNTPNSTVHYVFDPSTNSWDSAAPLLNSRCYASAISIKGKIYIFGGYDANNNPTNWCEEFSYPTPTDSIKCVGDSTICGVGPVVLYSTTKAMKKTCQTWNIDSCYGSENNSSPHRNIAGYLFIKYKDCNGDSISKILNQVGWVTITKGGSPTNGYSNGYDYSVYDTSLTILTLKNYKFNCIGNPIITEQDVQPNSGTLLSTIYPLDSPYVVPVTSPVEYKWLFNNKPIKNATDTFLSAYTSGEYSLIVIDSDGIDTSNEIKIAINPNPIAKWKTTVNCSKVTFVPNSDTNNTYKWYFGNGDSSTNFEPTYDYTTDARYHIRLVTTSTNGCSDEYDSTIIILYQLPNAKWTASTNCNDVSLTPDSLNINTYKWYFGDGDSSTVEGPVYDYKAYGLYQIKLVTTNTYGCVSEYDSSIKISCLSGIDETVPVHTVNMYPNPTNSTLYINSPMVLLNIRIVNVLGETVYENTNTTSPVDLSGLAVGTYCVFINGLYQSKVVILR